VIFTGVINSACVQINLYNQIKYPFINYIINRYLSRYCILDVLFEQSLRNDVGGTRIPVRPLTDNQA